MKYILGFDGGATKTCCVLGDLEGNILEVLEAGPSNYQNIGIDVTRNTIESLYKTALNNRNLKEGDIAFVFLGLAGADLPADFKILNGISKDVFKTIPFEVVNDAWIIMRSGTPDAYGAVSIYGTGANAGAINNKGEMNILRALTYKLGGAGGGGEIADDALHFAFRSNEQTYKKSSLETELPKLLNTDSIDALLEKLYPEYNLSYAENLKITPLVFKLAKEGDEVCQEILTEKGKLQGRMVNGVLTQAGMINTTFPVVLGGSVYKGESPYFVNAMKQAILDKSPAATFNYPKLKPAAGSYLFALDRLNKKLSDDELSKVKESLKI